MYIVMCKADTVTGKWAPYSGKVETMEQAEEIKEAAEKLNYKTVSGKAIIYRIDFV